MISVTIKIELETAGDPVELERAKEAFVESLQDYRWRKVPFTAIEDGDDYTEIFVIGAEVAA